VTYVNWSDKVGRTIVADIILTKMLRCGDGNNCKKTSRTALYLTTDKDHWLILSIRELTWPTVANILATLPPISPILDGM
jgi:hypothetical protein